MRRRSPSLWLLWTVGMSVIACGQESRSDSSLRSIIDEDSLQPVGDGTQLPASLRGSLGAIGKLTGGCTAFHLGDGLVATAGHCLPKPTKTVAESACGTYSIQWNGEAQPSHCLRYLAYQYDEQSDFALIEVDPLPPTHIHLPTRDDRADRPSRALVIGYPKDRPLSTTAQACQARWETGTDEQKFFHDCDTLPGHSGSPVLDADSAQLIGVHDGDAEKANYGSFLPSLRQLHQLQEQLRAEAPPPSQLSFGPFGNNEMRVLFAIPSRWSKRAKLHVHANLEAPYDKLVLIDGIGRRTELTGASDQDLDLPLPLSAFVQTDYSGNSQLIEVKDLTLYTP